MRTVPLLGSVMTPFPHCIDSEEPLSRARARMAEHGIRHLPVMAEGRLVGVITDRDIGLAAGPDPIPAAEDVAVRAIAANDVYAVDIQSQLDDVLLEMAERQVGSALVTRRGKLVGIFTATDACRCFGNYLRDLRPGDDEAA